MQDLVWYVDFGNGTSTGYYAVTAWATGITKVAGNLIRQSATPAVGNERVFVCVASTGGTGSTGGAEPAWTTTRGAKTTDNTLTWQEATGVAALNGDLTNTPTWNAVKGTSVTLGQVIQNVAGTLILICTTAGTAGAGAEPSWSAFTNAGATTADNTVTWTTLGASFGSWAAPHARLGSALASTWGQAGNTFWVASEHAETQTTSNTLNPPGTQTSPNFIYCVTKTAVPPTAANLTTGASISCTGNGNTLGLMSSGANSNVYWYGLTFQVGSGANFGTLSLTNGNGASYWFKNCTFALLGTSISSGINISQGGSATNVRLTCESCTFTQGSITNNTYLGGAGTNIVATFRGCTFTFAGNPFSFLNGYYCSPAFFECCDISSMTSGHLVGAVGTSGTINVFKDCKIASAVTFSTPPNWINQTHLVRTDSSVTYRQELYHWAGTQTTDNTVVRTGGASDGTTAISWKVVLNGNSSFVTTLFETIPISIWNTKTAVNTTVTVFGVLNAASLPTSANIWPIIEYLGSATSPLGTVNDGGVGDPLGAGSNWTADTSAWDSAATARANTTAYTAGQVIKVASNPGRIFICTTSGTSAGAEPAGYASAVDGGSVTDNTAVFRAGVRFKMAITLSAPQPQLAGPITTYLRAVFGTSTFWIDPLVVIS